MREVISKVFYDACIIVTYIILGRRFAEGKDFITVDLSHRMRILLFGVDVSCERISICGIIWQVLTIITLFFFLLSFVVPDSIISKKQYHEWLLLFAGIHLLCVGVLMAIYSCICELCIKDGLKFRKCPKKRK